MPAKHRDNFHYKNVTRQHGFDPMTSCLAGRGTDCATVTKSFIVLLKSTKVYRFTQFIVLLNGMNKSRDLAEFVNKTQHRSRFSSPIYVGVN